MRRFPDLDHEEFAFFPKADSPSKIQDLLDAIPTNFEIHRRTCRSPLMTLRHRQAHCMEGAMLAAAILWYHGEPPLVLDLKTAKGDDDHVVVLFREKGHWGAISKTNHAVLRYRDAVYRDVRELAMSYFNEYFLDSGRKTLRSYSAPFSLLRYGEDWLTAREHLWDIPYDLDRSRHFKIVDARVAKTLRPAAPIEIEAGKIVEWRNPGKRRKGQHKKGKE